MYSRSKCWSNSIKMNLHFVVWVLTSAVFFVRGQSIEKCVRPDRSEGMCVLYNECPDILEQINNPAGRLHDLMKYRCGFEGNIPKVCCDFCYTPEGLLGHCKNVTECPHLNKMYKQNDVAKSYVRTSRCLTGKYHVCCGPAPRAEYFQPLESCSSQLSAFPPHPNSLCCGYDASASESRITGGNDTALDQYPWLVLLEYRKTGGHIGTYCGGALISNRYVLTAAHCISGSGAWPPINVRLGEYDTSSVLDCKDDDCADPTVTVAIEDIITHPEYNPTKSQNDIALIRLQKPVPYTDFIRPICLPKSKARAGRDAYVAGWGKVNSTHVKSVVKQHVKLPIVERKNCQEAFDARMLFPPKLSGYQLCSGGEDGKDSCNGDSGGPLMVETNALYELAGVVSFGQKECGTPGLPGVYTNVYEYLPWIWRNIRP